MSTIPETSLSILSQSNSPSATGAFTGILLAITTVAAAVYYASPTHLTPVLVSALADTEKAYLAAAENGVLGVSTEDVAEKLSILQLQVSVLREASLRSSLSFLSTLSDMFNLRRSVAVLRCLGELRGLGTRIEISNETQLREVNSHPLSTIFLRRRASRV